MLGPEQFHLTDADRRRHNYVLGATGSGKTTLLLRLIESDLRAKRTVCLLDLRGDLVDRILGRLINLSGSETWRDRLCLIDLRADEYVVGFNPLVGQGDACSRALHCLSVLKAEAESWGVQLDETLRNCLVALAEAGLSLIEVESLLSQVSFRNRILNRVQDPFVRAFFERYGELSEDRQVTWRLPVLNKLGEDLRLPARDREATVAKRLSEVTRFLKGFRELRPDYGFSVSLLLDDVIGSHWAALIEHQEHRDLDFRSN